MGPPGCVADATGKRSQVKTVRAESYTMLKVGEVDKRVSCSESTVYALIETRRLGRYRCTGVRVSEAQLTTFLEETKQEPGTLIGRSGIQTFKHLNAERLQAARQKQGVRSHRRGGGNARSSE